MSICKTTAGALVRTRVAVNISTTKTLAPFLYQTPTIQQWYPVTDRTARRNASSYRRTDEPVPFERDTELPPVIEESQPPRKSTMTGSERKAFEKLYKNVKKNASDPLSDDFLDDEALGSGTSIDSVFDAVLSGRASAKQRSLKRPVENLQTLAESILQQEAKQAPQEKPETEKVPTDPMEALNRARDAERERVQSLMLDAQTDHELWQILEREVIAPIRALDLDGVQAHKEHLARQVRTSYRYKYKLKRLAKPEFRRIRKDRKEMREKWDNVMQPFRNADETLYPPTAGPDPRILFHNFPALLLFTARLLQKHFPTSPLPLSILGTIKSLGRSSAALGSTTNLYNLLIRTLWTQSAAPGTMFAQIDELLSDMENSGIEFDRNTWALVHEVIGEFRWVRAGRAGKALRQLSLSQQVQEGVGKLEGWRAVMEMRLGVVREAARRGKEREGALDGRGTERETMSTRFGEREFVPFEYSGGEAKAGEKARGEGIAEVKFDPVRRPKIETIPVRNAAKKGKKSRPEKGKTRGTGKGVKARERSEEEKLDRELLLAEVKRD